MAEDKDKSNGRSENYSENGRNKTLSYEDIGAGSGSLPNPFQISQSRPTPVRRDGGDKGDPSSGKD